jgi:Transposase DDE domain group 1
MLFEAAASRRVEADFSGGHLSSNGGVLLLRQIDRGLGVCRTLAQCFQDHRDPLWVEHSLEQLLSQRIHAVALGYEDLNDHTALRVDPLLALCAGKADPLGLDRLDPAQKGKPLASASTLNRLELGNSKESRCHKIQFDPAAIEDALLKLAVRALPKHATEIVLDLDAMGHLVHGLQEGRHYSDYYGDYCYLPLYVVCGDVVLWAQLRTSDKDGADGVVAALQKIIPVLRKRCKRARIIIRGDSGFCREEIMAWCEAQQLHYCLGLSKNSRLLELTEETLMRTRINQCLCGGSVRGFTQFMYQTLQSWTRQRRVIAKAEVSSAGDNPRFVVTNLPADGFKGQADPTRFEPQRLYEELYCQRGDMENILKQQTLDLRADRHSTHCMESNQLRLWLATAAYLLVERLRALSLQGTELARATVGTIRNRLFKVAAAIQVSVRRVYVQMSSSFVGKELFLKCQRRLSALFALQT